MTFTRYCPSRSRVRAFAVPLLAVACTACSAGPGESESKMTSYTASEKKADTARTFHITPEQTAHIEIVSARRENLPRTLRLSGAVAYNAFLTTPVFAAIGGPAPPGFRAPDRRLRRRPAHEILVAPGQVV